MLLWNNEFDRRSHPFLRSSQLVAGQIRENWKGDVMTDPWDWADDLGPEKIVYLHDAAVGLRAVVAIDNTAADHR